MESKDRNYKQINHDYARTKWPNRKISNNLGAWIVVMIIFMIGFGLMMASAVRADQCSITGAVYDDLMSPDMAAYTVLYGHGQEYENTDME